MRLRNDATCVVCSNGVHKSVPVARDWAVNARVRVKGMTCQLMRVLRNNQNGLSIALCRL